VDSVAALGLLVFGRIVYRAARKEKERDKVGVGVYYYTAHRLPPPKPKK